MNWTQGLALAIVGAVGCGQAPAAVESHSHAADSNNIIGHSFTSKGEYRSVTLAFTDKMYTLRVDQEAPLAPQPYSIRDTIMSSNFIDLAGQVQVTDQTFYVNGEALVLDALVPDGTDQWKRSGVVKSLVKSVVKGVAKIDKVTQEKWETYSLGPGDKLSHRWFEKDTVADHRPDVKDHSEVGSYAVKGDVIEVNFPRMYGTYKIKRIDDGAALIEDYYPIYKRNPR
jgi:hypothetical protein